MGSGCPPALHPVDAEPREADLVGLLLVAGNACCKGCDSK